MSCFLLALAVTFVSSVGTASTSAAPSRVRGAIGAGLRGPSGLDATVYAKGLKHIAALATDAQGRVWVATAAASDTGKDAIYLVAEAGATPQKVVTDVHTPLGLLWIGDTLYVSQADSVLALAGFDGSTFASRATVVSFPEGTGEVNGITVGGRRTPLRGHLGTVQLVHAPPRPTRRRSCRSCPTAATSRCSPATSAPPSGSRSSPAPTTCS